MITTTNATENNFVCKSCIDGNQAHKIKKHIDVCFKIDLGVKWEKNQSSHGNNLLSSECEYGYFVF
jgi:hypothetical protein